MKKALNRHGSLAAITTDGLPTWMADFGERIDRCQCRLLGHGGAAAHDQLTTFCGGDVNDRSS